MTIGDYYTIRANGTADGASNNEAVADSRFHVSLASQHPGDPPVVPEPTTALL